MQVLEVDDGMAVQANCAYIIAPSMLCQRQAMPSRSSYSLTGC
jgi:chemotaxis response regulator CheB